jgi:hypothetical protein
MFTDIAFVSRPQSLLEIAGRAIAATKEKSLAEFDSAYKAGNISTAFLKDYILRRERAGITSNAELIEKYVAAVNFTRNTWSKDFNEGQKNWYLKMLQYYTGVKDTAKYLRNATVL